MKIVLISCVSMKRDYPTKAKDLYISPWFKGAYRYAKKLQADKIFILSDKYGLLDENAVIEPYDVNISSFKTAELKQWAYGVYESLRKVSNPESDEYIILAGEKYRRYLAGRLKHVKVPLEGYRIGEQLAFFSNNR